MLTYHDRLRAMRDTKIAHTLKKREQQGYTDLDDFGTVPVPDGYSVDVWYNSPVGSFYGPDGMSENFVRVLNAHPAYVDPMEMLCGRWRDMLVNYRGDTHYAPKWVKRRDDRQLTDAERRMWSKRWDETRFPYDDLKPLQKKYNIASGIDGDAHLACDYSIGFALGFGGLLEKIRHYRNINPDKKAFYDAEEKVLLAMISFVDRHIEKIREMIPAETRPEIRASLEEMLAVNEKIRLGKPETFYEVCQWTAYFNCCSRIYTRDGAGFRLDVLLYPYYLRDKEAGILDDEKAKFLIANLLLIDPHYYQLSGVDEHDRDMTNPLSYLILDAADAINIACNLTVKYHENCDREFLKKAVSCLFRNKNGWPRFCNDRALCEGYMKNGVPKDVAQQRIAVGCHWMCLPGVEFPMNDTVKINIAKVLEAALEDMKDEPEKSSERLFALYEKHLAIAMDTVARGVNLHIDHQAEVTPELVMNLLMRHTLEEGKDISQCAEYYTVGVDGAGLAIVADSFGAIETRIEDEGILSWDTLYENLANNFDGTMGERVRLMLKSAPKYCEGGTVSDAWAKRLTDSFVSAARNQPMPAGRMLIPGWFSWARTIEYGAVVGATPNGRRSGEPLSHGANPEPGFRQDGAVTAQASGIASVQCGFGNTVPLQLEFDPLIGMEEGGVDRVLELIEAHFRQGGTLININVLDRDTLMEANKNPDLHPDLVVRVTGFTAYFASLSPKFRQLVVDRFLTGL